MSDSPVWLPPKAAVVGSRDQVIAALYRIFDADFRRSARQFRGVPVRWDQQVRAGSSYEAGFWHLISREDASGVRHFDPLRAERLPWCGPLLDHGDDPAVLVWDERAGRPRPRTHVWLESWDYLVVLELREVPDGVVWYLITALYVDGPNRRRGLRRRYVRNSRI